MFKKSKSFRRFFCGLLFTAIFSSASLHAAPGEWGRFEHMHNYYAAFQLPKETSQELQVDLIESNVNGNVYWPGEQPEFVFQIQNKQNEKLAVDASVELIRYAQSGIYGDQWFPKIEVLEKYTPQSLSVSIEKQGWKNFTVVPQLPETNGGYALILDLKEAGRFFLTSMTRTFAQSKERVQYPKQALDNLPAEILQKLGIKAIRFGLPFAPEGTKKRKQVEEMFFNKLEGLDKHNVTIALEIGSGREGQIFPGVLRGHMKKEDGDVLKKTRKGDLVWHPKHDDDYQDFVYKVLAKYGWPKGPITGIMLWNEPWEGRSISGWQADIPRYRELYKRMGEAVFEAREKANVDVLIGGADSSSNTYDKLFPDGKDTFLPYLDFCSIHYHGLNAPAYNKDWLARKEHKGRVLIWDTESWVANTDDRFAGVVAACRAAGYDRTLGSLSRIAVSSLSHHRIEQTKIRVAGKKKLQKVAVPLNSRPLAAAYGAVQKLIGERDFDEILFKTGLPWVFTFSSQDNPEDGTAVVLGDLDALFNRKGATSSTLHYSVGSLEEVKSRSEARTALKNNQSQLSKEEELALHSQLKNLTAPWENVWFTIAAAPGSFVLYDRYGNIVPAEKGKYRLLLNEGSHILKANPNQAGSYAKLKAALKAGKIEGLQPVEIIAYDFLESVEQGTSLRLKITNVLERPVVGELDIAIGNLKIEGDKKVKLAPRTSQTVLFKVKGHPNAQNTYPLDILFDAGRDGQAVHREDLRVNLITQQKIAVDGELSDWDTRYMQIIQTSESASRSFMEAMFLPFAKDEKGEAGGYAEGYLAYDEDYFYFATKVADSTPYEGTVRYAERDDDQYYYPESFEYEAPSGKRTTHHWPKDVRRFSYRKSPDIPSGGTNKLDNVLIAFNALEHGTQRAVASLPGNIPKFTGYACSDYQFALNLVAPQHGGGTEIWRLMNPDLPHKHYFPRQPKAPGEGPVETGKLAFKYVDNTRIVEVAIPWVEIPDVKKKLQNKEPIKFSYRINELNNGPLMELAHNRSVSRKNNLAFYPDWWSSWANELEFRFE